MIAKNRPNFFIIGAPRSGTTALSEYLRSHPNVFISDPKEPEYFATDFPRRLISKEGEYLRLFNSADPSHHLAIGEASTIYIFSKEAVPNILNFYSQARFIAMLRNPVDLVVSLHGFLVSRGVERYQNFWEAWEIEKKRKATSMTFWKVRNPQMFWYSEWGRLGSQLRRIMEIVPINQLKVIIYDDFVKDARRVYLEVLDFLKIPDDGRVQFLAINERRRPKNYVLLRYISFLVKLWLPLRVRVTGGRGFGIGDRLNRLLTDPVNKEEKMSIEGRRYLIDYYREEIHLLEELLERDLSHWLCSEH